jgi:hypothetical protein
MTCGVPTLFSIAKIEASLLRHRFHTDKEDKEKIVSLVD